MILTNINIDISKKLKYVALASGGEEISIREGEDGDPCYVEVKICIKTVTGDSPKADQALTEPVVLGDEIGK